MKQALTGILALILTFVMTNSHAAIKIYAPKNNATIQHPKNLEVKFIMSQSNADIKQLALMWDGQALMNCGHCEHFQVPNPDRGTHTLSVEALDDNGDVLEASQSITVNVHQPSIYFKKPRGQK